MGKGKSKPVASCNSEPPSRAASLSGQTYEFAATNFSILSTKEKHNSNQDKNK